VVLVVGLLEVVLVVGLLAVVLPAEEPHRCYRQCQRVFVVVLQLVVSDVGSGLGVQVLCVYSRNGRA
jgi:hypothetical protein